MSDHRIIGIHVVDRVHHATEVQSLLTEFGCHIRTRIGLHDASSDHCSPNGLIVLELCGDEGQCDAFVSKLNALPSVEVKEMVFKHT